jgi:hypothetical protein
MINAKLQSIIDTKSAIGNAIVNKGGTITGETPFFNYAAQIDGISTGTPQTIFAASDGSKWALTNVVNIVNSAGNVTYDFNRWQPANNSTSDPILNIGTVGANISGNIRIVQVNQVNIAQYVNLVATDTLGGKYVGYNGFDQITNPTPTGNTTFNRWLLNNSASGTVLFANATFVNGGTYNGPNTTVNEASMPFVSNGPSYGSNIRAIAFSDNFVFFTGDNNRRIVRLHESNLVLVNSSSNTDQNKNAISINNSFIYATEGQTIARYHLDNLAFVNVSGSVDGAGTTILAINNGFIFTGRSGIRKLHESNLILSAQTTANIFISTQVKTNNSFVYSYGQTMLGNGAAVAILKKYHESNLVFVSNAAIDRSYGGTTMAINNGFIYTGGSDNNQIFKYNESTLALVGNTSDYNHQIDSIFVSNGFIYAGGHGNATNGTDVKKYYEGNLAFVGNTGHYGGLIHNIATNNGFIYVGGRTNPTIKKYNQSAITAENLSFFNITTIKE